MILNVSFFNFTLENKPFIKFKNQWLKELLHYSINLVHKYTNYEEIPWNIHLMGRKRAE